MSIRRLRNLDAARLNNFETTVRLHKLLCEAFRRIGIARQGRPELGIQLDRVTGLADHYECIEAETASILEDVSYNWRGPKKIL